MKIVFADLQTEKLFSEHAYSPKSGLSYQPLEPSDFSFNHPSGMCPSCQGLGIAHDFDLTKILSPTLSIAEDCCHIASSFHTVKYGNIYSNLARIYKFDLHTPWKDLPEKAKNVFLYGTGEKWTKMRFVHPEKKHSWTEFVSWKGVLHEAKERYLSAQSESYRKKMEANFHQTVCPDCKGSRIKPYPSAARLQDKTIFEITQLSVREALCFFKSLKLSPEKQTIAEELVKEVIDQLSFLDRVGLHYLSLERTAPTLSGGEGQRVRLASQIGSGLVGATYILDEPSIGLHPRDNKKLLETLLHLKQKGNTVIVVEHDEETILAADTVVDVGPLAGKNGGRILCAGSLQQLLDCQESITGGYLSGRLKIAVPSKRRKKTKQALSLQGASHHNLKNVSVSFPLGLLISVTGVSGSGKSSLIIDTLYPALANALNGASLEIGAHKALKGIDAVDKVIAIDQAPIGRTPRSNPATYIKLFDEIRDLFTLLPESQMQGFTAGRFSFNVKEGCCPFCAGMGMVKIDMDFLEDEWVTCEHCQGKRFDDITLSVQYKGKTIHDILEMSVLEAHEFFASIPKIKTKLDLLMKVGLDYIKLGQPSPTLSGGEAQRIKLAKELSRPSSGKTFYILDEPTTGLHFHDVQNLVSILHSLVDKGNTVLVIEHNMDLIKTSDWIIDIGPEAGAEGGEIVAEGPPEQISNSSTPTGLALKESLSPQKMGQPSSPLLLPPSSYLTVKGAMQNNLKGVDVSIPLGQITVCTGPSGSGKSSFAFETIYAEGQRRYIESMSHYARQFVKQMPKPKIEYIEGLSAAIAIEQKNHAGNPRSTIGTMTEIYDYLRIVYCHLGTPFCPETGEEIRSISKEYIVEKVMERPAKTKVIVLSQVFFSKNEPFSEWKEKMAKQGFLRIRLNGAYYELEEEIPFDRKRKNEILLVIDRLVLNAESPLRLAFAIEQAAALSGGSVVLDIEGKDLYFNLAFTVESTGKSYPPITPHTFSFNTKQGMCPECQGLGIQYGADLTQHKKLLDFSAYDLLFLLCKELASQSFLKAVSSLLSVQGIDMDIPLKDLPKEQLLSFFQGIPSSSLPLVWKGINQVLIQYTKSSSGNIKGILSQILEESPCIACEGTRLAPLARHVKIEGVSIAALCQKSIEETEHFLKHLAVPPKKQAFLEETFKQILSRLSFLRSLGLGYLSLGRSAPSLSGGETQRIRLSRQLGSGLTGCLYVLDEPTIGLHPYDNHLLNKALQDLKDLGNTLLLVEHDPMTLQIADYILDFGPGAGKFGGMITAEGSLEELVKNPNSLTGAYLSGKRKIFLPEKRKESKGWIQIENASLHNLQKASVSLPIGVFTCITGVSGSGKSTLLMDVLKPVAEKTIGRKGKDRPASPIPGLEAFDKLIVLEQNPIGTTIRADVSTYTELLTPLRHLYASLPEAKARGLSPKHFSFNHKKGMCKACWGLGTKTVSLQFLPSVRVECDSCKGHRLNPLSLQVSFKGKHLGEVLKLSVLQALDFFEAVPKVKKVLEALASVGLEYLSLGQEVASLSGGESQRLRLSRELAKRSTGKTLYLLDEPSIGLHSSDIEKLVAILHSLTAKGNTVVLIEHNLDLIANADYVVDIGPGAGIHGGKVLFSGTPEELISCPSSKTASFLQEVLSRKEE